MNSEDNGHTTRPISRFSRASRESVSNSASTQPTNTSTSPEGQQGAPVPRTSWASGAAPSAHPVAHPRTPVFTSSTSPGYQTDLKTSPFSSPDTDKISPIGESETAAPYSHLSARQLLKLGDEPLNVPEQPVPDLHEAFTQGIESAASAPVSLQRASEEPAPDFWTTPDRRFDQPVQSGPGFQPEGAVGATPGQIDANTSRQSEEPQAAPRPADARRSSFAEYIPQQARELSSLISRFSLKRTSAGGESKDSAPPENKRFALVPYIPPQARGLSAVLVRLRDKIDSKAAAEQASKLLRVARTEAARIAAKSAQVAAKSAQKSAEGLTKAKQEISHNLKPDELKRNYQSALSHAHTKFFDSKLDQHFFIPTHTPGRELAVVSGGTTPTPAPSAPADGPTPQLVFEWALAALPQDLREFAFVDFRAGRGKALMLATRRNFEKVIGYEFDEQTHDDLLMNVAQFPRSLMACRNVECLRGDRDGLSIPEQPTVLFFSNALHEELVSVALNLAAASYRQNPRGIYVILFNPGPSLPSGLEEVFKPLPMALIDRLKLAALSPVKVAIYKTTP